MSSQYGNRNSEQEVVPGVLRGYRAWRLDGEHLIACNFNGVRWLPGRNEAVCLKGSAFCTCDACREEQRQGHVLLHHAPQGNCTCGYYAKHNPGTGTYDTRGDVIGVIKAYGRVILGTLGFRAEYAEIEALAIHRVTNLSSLARYEVPVFADPRNMVNQFPPIPVTELLPKTDEVDMSEMHSISPSGWAWAPSVSVAMAMTQTEWDRAMQLMFPNGNV